MVTGWNSIRARAPSSRAGDSKNTRGGGEARGLRGMIWYAFAQLSWSAMGRPRWGHHPLGVTMSTIQSRPLPLALSHGRGSLLWLVGACLGAVLSISTAAAAQPCNPAEV